MQSNEETASSNEKIAGLDYTPGFSPRIAQLERSKAERKERSRRLAVEYLEEQALNLWPDEGSERQKKHAAALRWAYVHGGMQWRQRDRALSVKANEQQKDGVTTKASDEDGQVA